jgi:hypothetical protein
MSEIRCPCEESYIAIDDENTLLGPCTVFGGSIEMFECDWNPPEYKCTRCSYIFTDYDLFKLERIRK